MGQHPNIAARRATLKAAKSPAAKLRFAIGFACFWNALLGFFLLDIIESFRGGNPNWSAVIIAAPFVLVGLALVGWVFYALLALFNPRPFVTVSSPVALDEGLEVEWETAGKVERVRSFRVTLEGREEATYTRGTTTSTDKETFSVLGVAEGPGVPALRQGKAKIAFPAHAMHSFDSGNNKIVWTLRMKGDIPFWPDVDEEYEIKVEPRRMESRA